MKKRTRLFLLVAAGVLGVGLGTGLIAAFVGAQNFGILGGSDGPYELDYVPGNARVIAYANVREVMDSELRQKIRRIQPSGNESFEKFQAETGIDVERDIDYVLMFMTEDDTLSNGGPPVVLARGRFNDVRIQQFLEDQGATAQDYNGTRLLVNEQDRVAIAFVEPGLAAFGMAAGVRRAIDTKAGGGTVRDNAELMQHIRDGDDGNAWMVGRFDALTAGRLPNDVASRLPAITWISASGYVNGGLRGVIRADARDETAAQDLRDVIRGFVALARMQAGQQAEFAELMNSLQLGGDGTTVSLAFSVPSEMIDALGALSAGRQRELPQPDEPVRPSQPRPRRPAPPSL